MIYAPIIIPTLNRVGHLKQCIGSLQKNGWAKYTQLIIGVDYPPSEKYVEGYNEVCRYLANGIMGFSKVEILYHSENFGAYQNYIFLHEYASKRFDRYIFTEDDNEFSPNFIEYIDKGLELFEKDEEIIAICSRGTPDLVASEYENVVHSRLFSAYGFGTWSAKASWYHNAITRENFIKLKYDVRKLIQLFLNDPVLVLAYQSAILQKEQLYQLPNNEIPVIDMTINIYMQLEKKDVITPCIYKTRNCGYDGSGVNCQHIIQKMERIDTMDTFEYHCGNQRYEKEIINRKFEVKLRAIFAIIRILLSR